MVLFCWKCRMCHSVQQKSVTFIIFVCRTVIWCVRCVILPEEPHNPETAVVRCTEKVYA